MDRDSWGELGAMLILLGLAAVAGFAISDCVAHAEPKRVEMCLVNSSACGHDRNTRVWDDQVEEFLRRYPGSYRGQCDGECHTHEDDCIAD